MSGLSFWDDEDVEERDVTREEITACDDTDELSTWYEGLQCKADRIIAQIEAARIGGLTDDAWLWRACRALAYTKMGMSQIKRRARLLGHEVDREGSAYANLERTYLNQRAELLVARQLLTLAESELGGSRFARMRDAAIAEMQRADLKARAA